MFWIWFRFGLILDGNVSPLTAHGIWILLNVFAYYLWCIFAAQQQILVDFVIVYVVSVVINYFHLWLG